ncbi:MAG: hypothetical protein LC775_10905 [Acidobacteria bacterium]|nr:hypothetical protein [Acidobacteriota bacterium]
MRRIRACAGFAAVQDEVRTRLLRLFRRRDPYHPMTAAAMRRWERSTPPSASRPAIGRCSKARASVACWARRRLTQTPTSRRYADHPTTDRPVRRTVPVAKLH